MVSSDDKVKLAVAPCDTSELKRTVEVEKVSRYFTKTGNTRTRNQESTRYHTNAAKSTSGKQGEASTQ